MGRKTLLPSMLLLSWLKPLCRALSALSAGVNFFPMVEFGFDIRFGRLANAAFIKAKQRFEISKRRLFG